MFRFVQASTRRENSAAYARINHRKERSLRRFRSTLRNTEEQRKNQRSLASGSAYRASNPLGGSQMFSRICENCCSISFPAWCVPGADWSGLVSIWRRSTQAIFRARHQVSIDVHRDLNRAVAHFDPLRMRAKLHPESAGFQRCDEDRGIETGAGRLSRALDSCSVSQCCPA